MLNSSLILLLTMISLTACWGPDEKSARDKLNSDTANFEVTKKSFVDSEMGNIENFVWKIPRENNYVFKACVQDSYYERDIVNQRFDVVKGREVFPAISDEDGCFTWQEKVAYNLFARPQFAYEKRYIQGVGSYKGRQSIYCFVNPWGQLNGKGLSSKQGLCLGHKDQVKDYEFLGLSYANGPEVLSAESERSIWVKDLKVNITNRNYVDEVIDYGDPETESDDKPRILKTNTNVIEHLEKKGYRVNFPNEASGLPLHFDFSFKPYAELKNRSGEDIDYLLKGGQYKVWAYVVATDFGENKNERRILNPMSEPKIARYFTKDDTVRVSIQTMITELADDANYHLLIRARPLNAPIDMGSFEAVYNFSINWTSMLGQKSPYLEKDTWELEGQFKFDEYLSTMNNYSTLKKFWDEKKYDAPEAYKLSTYEYDTLEVRFKRIQPGETATNRTVELRAKTCISMTKNGRRAKSKTFFVQRIRDDRAGQKDENGDWKLMPQTDPGEAEELKTDHQGCLVWTDEIRHKYYMPEKYIFPKAEIWDPENPKERKVLTLVVNPWDEKWTFGHDRRDLTEKYIQSIQNRQTVQSRFYLTNYAYQTLRFRYYIDKYMNLTVRKTVLLRLDPTVLRYSSIVYGRRGTERLRDGIYLMKVALQKNYLDPAAKGLVITREQPMSDDLVPKNSSSNPGSADNRTRIEGVHFHEKNSEVYYQTSGDTERDRDAYDTDIGANLRQREYITVVRKLVRVQDGKIITPVEFSMRDLRLMKIRSNFLVQLETIREEDLLEVNILKGKLKDQVEKALSEIKEVRDLSEQERIQLLDRISRDQSSLVAEVNRLSKRGVNLNDRIVTIVDLLIKGNSESLLDKIRNGNEPEPSTTTVQAYVDNSSFIERLYEELEVGTEIREQVKKEALDAIKLNDFTMYDASPFGISFNELIDHHSGLGGRTFVGPMTLIFNSNYSNIRPTDNLNETFCEVDDCNELKFGVAEDFQRGQYENSEFFGSIRHLRGIQVDKMIEKKKKIESEYLTEMAASSLVYNFVEFNNLDFVSLENERLIRFEPNSTNCKKIGQEGYFDYDFSDYKDQVKLDKPLYFLAKRGCVKYTNRNTVGSDLFLERLNQFLLGKNRFSSDDVKKIINDFFARDEMTVRQKLQNDPGQGFSTLINNNQKFLNQMCSLLSRIHKPGSSQSKNWNKSIGSSCRRLVADGKADEVFTIEKKYRIFDTTGNYNFKGGKSMNINVGDSFNVNRAERMSFDGKLYPFGEFIGQATGGMLGLSWGKGQVRSTTEGTSVTSQTFLVMQTAALDVELASYEKCLVFRWKPSYLTPTNFFGLWEMNKFDTWYDDDVSDEERKKLFFGGVMLCSGKVEEKPQAVRERYFYMTQHFTDGDMLDPGDLYNHPWLLSLRGVRDFETFIRAIRAQNVDFVNEDDMFFSKPIHSSWQWPIEKLNETYRNVLPTFPGMFTQLLRVQEEADYPWVIDADVSYYNERSDEESTYDNSWGLELDKNWFDRWTDGALGEKLKSLKNN